MFTMKNHQCTGRNIWERWANYHNFFFFFFWWAKIWNLWPCWQSRLHSDLQSKTERAGVTSGRIWRSHCEYVQLEEVQVQSIALAAIPFVSINCLKKLTSSPLIVGTSKVVADLRKEIHCLLLQSFSCSCS